jgi:phage tail sheath protein FI
VPFYQAPGVYIEEVASASRPIEPVGTSTAAFLGVAPNADKNVNQPTAVNSWSEFRKLFVPEGAASTHLSNAVNGFFLNQGRRCWIVNTGEGGSLTGTHGRRGPLEQLETLEGISMVAAPGYTGVADYDALVTHCERMKYRMAILDAPEEIADFEALTRVATTGVTAAEGERAGLRGPTPANGHAAQYTPWIQVRDHMSGQLVWVPPSGHIAGIYARTDATRGVHKAPANERVNGALDLRYRITSEEQGILNPAGINVIRFFPRPGITVWGARTLAEGSSPFRYVPVRRLLMMVEESIALSTRWVVFEPNDEPLWKRITRDVRAFLTVVHRDGALKGRTPDEAFFVQCDGEVNTAESVDAGMVITRIGLAPVKPAEFVIFQIGFHEAAAEGTVEEEGGGTSG